ncbi:MAG: hypothetical protein CVU87_05825 [Firmicutes bacterium HGW-Firmicutes-12]|jgi:hypothetical protein|nr:MAG: hypothetical protein CVU87_05825 [Firmicutes bacterium HGW-Firmicutes-12]
MFGRMIEVNTLIEQLSFLVIDEKKKLTAQEVLYISQKLDKLIIRQMKEKNGLNKQLTFSLNTN